MELTKNNLILNEQLKPLNNAWYQDFNQVLKYQITSKSDIIPEIPIVTFNGALWVKQGGFGVISGKPKAGKSTVLESVIIQALRNSDSPKSENLGMNVEPANEKKVIVVDTEQSPADVQDAIIRINKALGRNKGDDDARLMYFAFRELDSTEEVKNAVNSIMENAGNIHLIIIDGIADLINDPFGDATGARLLIKKLMGQTSKFNFALIVVIHENYRDVKLTGHLGTELSKKTSGVLTVTKRDDYHFIKASTLRKSQDPVITYFMRDKDGSAYAIDKPSDNGSNESGLTKRTLKLQSYLEEVFGSQAELEIKIVRARLKDIVLKYENDRYSDPTESKFKTYVSTAINEMMCSMLKPIDNKRDYYCFRPISA